MRGQSLPDRAYVVVLALHREQHGALDRLRLDLAVLIVQLSERQHVILEHQLHGLQIELGGEIEHSKIFVVKGLGLRRFRFVAARAR